MSNVDSLAEIAAFVRTNPDRFHQSTWACGTGACVAGWRYLLDNSTEEQRAEHSDDLEELAWGGDVNYHARQAFGLSQREADALFRHTIVHALDPGWVRVCGTPAEEVPYRLACPVGPTAEDRALALMDVLIARDTGTLSEDGRVVLEHYGLPTDPDRSSE